LETSSNPVPFVCPCCHKKTTGYQRKDGAILVVCHRCKAKIFSKQHNKEILIKIKVGKLNNVRACKQISVALKQ